MSAPPIIQPTAQPPRGLIEGNGGAYPGRRDGTSDRFNGTSVTTASGIDGLDFPLGGLPGPTDWGGPYAVKNAVFHAVKRMAERTPFPGSKVKELQDTVDLMGLDQGSYHLPIRHGGKLVGFAQFKSAPDRKGPVLATVLSPHMKPGGKDIEKMLKRAYFDTDHLDPREPNSSANNGVHLPVDNQSMAYRLRHAFQTASMDPQHEVVESNITNSMEPL